VERLRLGVLALEFERAREASSGSQRLVMLSAEGGVALGTHPHEHARSLVVLGLLLEQMAQPAHDVVRLGLRLALCLLSSQRLLPKRHRAAAPTDEDVPHDAVQGPAEQSLRVMI
jgi:hypothetical protein